MSIAVDRTALANAVRSSPGFRQLTREIEAKTVRMAVSIADQRVERRTGAYVGNFETTVTPLLQTTNLARLRLFNSKPHAIFIEAGTVAHKIPKGGPRLLVFEVDGETIFRNTVVDHPGTKPQHVIRDALLKIASGANA